MWSIRLQNFSLDKCYKIVKKDLESLLLPKIVSKDSSGITKKLGEQKLILLEFIQGRIKMEKKKEVESLSGEMDSTISEIGEMG